MKKILMRYNHLREENPTFLAEDKIILISPLSKISKLTFEQEIK